MVEKIGYYGLLFYCVSIAVSRAAVHASIAVLAVLFLGSLLHNRFRSRTTGAFLRQCTTVDNRGLACFILGMGISLLASNNPLVSLKTIVTFAYYFLPLFFIDAFIRTKEQLSRLCYFLAASMTIGGGIAVFQGIQGANRAKGALGVMDLGGALGFLISMIAILGLYAFQEKKLKTGAFFTVAAMIGIGGLLANGTRINWVEIAIAFPLFVIMNLRRLSKMQIGLLVTSGAVFVLILAGNHSVVERIYSIFNLTTDASNYKRLEMWEYGINVFLQHPIIGVGIGVLPKLAFDKLEHIDYIMTDGSYGHIHSVCIQLLAETGIVGMSLYFLFLFYTFVRPWWKSNDAQQPWASILMILLVSFFINGLTDHILGIGPIMYSFSILTAICLKGMRLNSFSINRL